MRSVNRQLFVNQNDQPDKHHDDGVVAVVAGDDGVEDGVAGDDGMEDGVAGDGWRGGWRCRWQKSYKTA